MKYAVGEKIRVKSFEEISKTLDGGNHLKGGIIYFNPEMEIHCGKIYKIKSYAKFGPYYQLESCEDELGAVWQWPEEWVEPVEEQAAKIRRFKIGDIAVVRPDLTCGMKYGNLYCELDGESYRGTVVHIKEITSTGNYGIEESSLLFSERMLLTIKEAFRYGTVVTKKDGSNFSNGQPTVHVNYIKGNEVWFRETKSWLWPHELKVLPEIYSSIDNKIGANIFTADFHIDVEATKKQLSLIEDEINSINLIKNKKDYENQLQREKTRIRGAEVPEGHRVRSRKCKASVVIGHLSNQARTGY